MYCPFRLRNEVWDIGRKIGYNISKLFFTIIVAKLGLIFGDTRCTIARTLGLHVFRWLFLLIYKMSINVFVN